MNRILFEKGEIVGGTATFGGDRAAHVLNVLHGEVGQTLKTGEIDGPIGTSEIIAIERGGNGPIVSVKTCHDRESLKPWIDIVLAPPRPRVMKRLLPQLAAMGVGRIVLVGAKKVEKDFWGATLLKEENYRPLLIDGLMQSGTSVMPEILCRRNFRRFLDDELDATFPDSSRIVAHPSPDASRAPASSKRPLLAIGPEGGWTDEEVRTLIAKGFMCHSLGPRILRTDTATIALIATLSVATPLPARSA